ncbi:hypothetical protein PRIPAC_71919, partial [Pristionchus pacificus]
NHFESGWSMVAQNIGDVIFISEVKEYDSTSNCLATYTGYKFEQYVTSNMPDCSPNTDEPVDNRPTFEKKKIQKRTPSN